MIDLHYWTTPNGHKITVFLEEAGLEYRVHPVNIGKGEQFAPGFLRIAPNNRIPAIVDDAPEKIAYAIERHVKETSRLYGVLDKRLADRAYIAGDDYSIADMASYPQLVPHRMHGQELAAFANLERWCRAVEARPAVQRAYAPARQINPPKQPSPDEDAARRKVRDGQDPGTVRR